MDWLAVTYSALVTTGGVIGYIKAGSVPSLVAGLSFGGLAGIGAYQVSTNPYNVYIITGTSGILMGVMGAKFLKSHKFMPAGFIASMSWVVCMRYGYRLIFHGQK